MKHKLFLCLTLLCAPVLAQISQVNGTITGVITDPGASPVPDASITATSLETGFNRNAQSSERGEYQVPMLPIGAYRIDVQAKGFAVY